MERLKNMKETLMNAVEGQLGHLDEVNTEELGEVVDMIKDFSEAIYYCTITKEMEEYKEEEEIMEKMKMKMMPYSRLDSNRMYYTEGRMDKGNRGYYDGNETDFYPYPSEIRDYREGRSPITRRNYMESKELHQDKSKQMKELEKYMKELTQDIMEMIDDASPEEKTILAQKLTTLAGKIQ